MDLMLEAGQTVLFTGDSITDCGRRGPDAPLGSGYVRSAVDLLTCRYPQRRLTCINTGISGNTIRDLFTRCGDDVIAHQPDWLSVMIGINDLWRWLTNQGAAAVAPAEYAELYAQLLTRVRQETSAKLILMDPFYISTDQGADSEQGAMLARLPRYLATVQRMAEEYSAVHVRTHEVFQTLLGHYGPERFCPEPVHPHAGGHTAIACAWLEAVGW